MHLKEFLDKNNIQYKDFAEGIGISHFTMQELIHKRRYPKMPLAELIEKETFGAVTLYDWFLDKKKPINNKQKKTKKSQKKES